MTKQKAIEILDENKPTIIFEDEERQKEMADIHTALDMGIEALGLIGSLNERPCEACVHHGENGCCKWTCVFDRLLYAEHSEVRNER